jgi:hypothetical protein
MNDSLTAPVPDAFSVSVIIEFVETKENRWQSGYWHIAGVVATSPDNNDLATAPLRGATESKQILHTGLDLRLYKDDAESYYFNLMSDNPSIFLICSQEDEGPLQPFIATLSYGEATSYMETEEIVKTVAMPPELYRWAEHFVLEHYVPEKRKKRKRENWKEEARGSRK